MAGSTALRSMAWRAAAQALAYDWLGNIVRELIGTATFGLLIAHNAQLGIEQALSG
ncbi:hypothetical protein [Phyllobacterium endophyticum]|uniref:hypothetical protein n=1 Tax=Phyllobacterium endophyticum TaxID=1149773 RepID=UPI00164F79B8|nr:hypothetical protein [Phyllobacterium endophyticum]